MAIAGSFEESTLEVKNGQKLDIEEQKDVNLINDFLEDTTILGKNEDESTLDRIDYSSKNSKFRNAWQNLENKFGDDIGNILEFKKDNEGMKKVEALKQKKLESMVEKMKIPPTFEGFKKLIRDEISSYKAGPYAYQSKRGNFLGQLNSFIMLQKGSKQTAIKTNVIGSLKRKQVDSDYDYSKDYTLSRITSNPTYIYKNLNNLKTSEVQQSFKGEKSLIAKSELVETEDYTLGDVNAVRSLGKENNDLTQIKRITNYLNNVVGNDEKIYIGNGSEMAQYNKNLEAKHLDSRSAFLSNVSNILKRYEKLGKIYGSGKAEMLLKNDVNKLANLFHFLGASGMNNSKNVLNVIKNIKNNGGLRIEKETYNGVSSQVFVKIMKPRLEQKYPGAHILGPKTGEGTVFVYYTVDDIVNLTREQKTIQFKKQMTNAKANVAGINGSDISNLSILENGSLTTMKALSDISINKLNKTFKISDPFFDTNTNIKNLQDYNEEILSKLSQISTSGDIDLKYTVNKKYIKKSDFVKSDVNISKYSLASGGLRNIETVKNNKGEVVGYNISSYSLGGETRKQIEKINKSKNLKAPSGYKYNLRNLLPKYAPQKEK